LDDLNFSSDKTTMMAPQFKMRPRDRRVQVTFPVRLTCQVIGFPKADVTWYHNDNAIIIGGDDGKSKIICKISKLSYRLHNVVDFIYLFIYFIFLAIYRRIDRHSYSVDGNFYTLEIATTKFDDAGIYSVQGRNSLVLYRHFRYFFPCNII
jgi:hypothetical protein